MQNDQHHAEGITGGAFNARVSPSQPAPAPARQPTSEGSVGPTAPHYSGHTRTADHLVPSTQPTLQIASAGLIARNLAGALKRLDAERLAQVQNLGIDGTTADDPRRLTAQLAAAVQKGDITNDEANSIWRALHGDADPGAAK